MRIFHNEVKTPPIKEYRKQEINVIELYSKATKYIKNLKKLLSLTEHLAILSVAKWMCKSMQNQLSVQLNQIAMLNTESLKRTSI